MKPISPDLTQVQRAKRALPALVLALLSGLAARVAHARPGADGPPARQNVLGTALAPCCTKIRAGFYRDGYCRVGPSDHGRHGVCAQVTAEFLEFTKQQGNDLSAPNPMADFAGLKPGDHWCLCVARWAEAHRAGKAPAVVLEATDEDALQDIPLEVLRRFAAKR